MSPGPSSTSSAAKRGQDLTPRAIVEEQSEAIADEALFLLGVLLVILRRTAALDLGLEANERLRALTQGVRNRVGGVQRLISHARTM